MMFEVNGLANAIIRLRVSKELGTPVDHGQLLSDLETFERYLAICSSSRPLGYNFPLTLLRSAKQIGREIDDAVLLADLEDLLEQVNACDFQAPMTWHEFKKNPLESPDVKP